MTPSSRILKFLVFQALADPYFKGLSKVEREPSCQPITKMEFEFERRRVTKEEIRELIFREILEYHPQLLKDYINGTERTNFLYPRFFFLVFFPLFVLFPLNFSLYFLLYYSLTLHWCIFFTVLLINSKSSLLILKKMVVKMVQLCHLKESMYHFPGN